MNLDKYIERVVQTNKLSSGDITPLLFGFFGEIGGVLSTSKKRHREKTAYTTFRTELLEEAGDAIWYFISISKHSGVSNATIVDWLRKKQNNATEETLDDLLMNLSSITSALIHEARSNSLNETTALKFVALFVDVITHEKISLQEVISFNLNKITSRFIQPDDSTLEDFDKDFKEDERLPEHFRIEIADKKIGKSYLKWKGVFIGDPLTDSIRDQDGYRFHDVFHLANAAILHWSPTFRSLIKHKRKSCPETEEAEDSGRAIVIEEGLTAWLFSYANTPELKLFENQDSVSYDVLKTVSQFTRGFEVSKCPLYLWEKSILEGFRVFRQVKANSGGIIIGDREKRTIDYQAF